MASPTPAHLAGAVAVAFLLGFAGGRLTAPEAAPAPGRPAQGPSTLTEARPGPGPATERRPTPATERQGPPAATGDPVDPTAVPPVDLAGTLAAARRVREAPDDHHASEAALAAAGLLEKQLGDDPAALAKALETFRTLGDPGDLEVLAAVLSRLADPQVEATALDIVRRDVSPARRVAAFDVLDGIEAPAAREAALEVLGSEPDQEVRRAALRALPEPRGASLGEAGPVVDTLARLLASDKDPELRRRAAASLGRWHRAEADLQPLLDALGRDASPEVRTGAAFGLEVAGRRTPAVVAALVKALANKEEDPAVRENCWQALSALGPLPPEAQAAWTAFRDARGAANEAGDHDHRHGPLEDH